jgi:hypothetical protein
MEHITEPVAALTEVRRVLKRGGVIAVRTAEHGEALVWPNDPDAQARFAPLWRRQKAAVGQNADIGRSLKAVLRAAGFSRIVGSASVETHGTPEETRLLAQEFEQALSPGNPVIDDALDRGWIGAADIEQMKAAWLAWGEHPDAFRAVIWCEAIGWTD